MRNVSTTQIQQLQSAGDAAGLCIRLLGPIAAMNEGRSVVIASRKARALLGYLALREGTEVARNILTGLLWGDRSDSQARASLRQTLSELRSALGRSAQDSIVATKETITWTRGSAWIDARVLQASAGSANEDVLRESAELIGGELMEGLAVGEAGFEQWLVVERERFHLIACKIYAQLMERGEHSGRFEEALAYGLKLLSLDPLREHVHRALMRIYASQGRHDAALAQYERCRRELSDQLGVKPEQETEELAQATRARRRDTQARRQISPSPKPETHKAEWPGMPDCPSIAVLPFTNLSTDPDQQYLSDGITEDIITAF